MSMTPKLHPIRSWRHTLRALVKFNEAPWRWSVGVQAGLAAGLPLAIFTATGYQPRGLTAMLGAFTALYCAQLRLIDRLRALPLVALAFVLAAAVGAFTSANVWLTVAGLIIVAVLACILGFGVRLGPPGPMMFVLVTGVSGHITAPPALGGAGTDSLLVTQLVALGSFSAYLIVVCPLLLTTVRRNSGASSTLREIFPLTPLDHISRIIIGRVIIAVTIASVVSVPLGVPHAYWVILTAGVVLQSGHRLRLPTIRAIQRVTGTILGVAAFALLAMTEPYGYWVVAIVALFQCAIEVVVVRNYGLAMIFITPLALTVSTTVRDTGTLVVGTDRIIDTILGAAIAMAVMYTSERYRIRRIPKSQQGRERASDGS